MSDLLTMARRYITQAEAEGLDPRQAEVLPYGKRTYSLFHDAWIEWHIVADDDPRVGTVEVGQRPPSNRPTDAPHQMEG